jgi:hypothetical protein
MSAGALAVPVEKVVVTVSGELEDGTKVAQSFEFPVAQGTPDAPILAAGAAKFRASGGIFVDDGNDLLFHLAYKMKAPVRFSINRIVVPSLVS